MPSFAAIGVFAFICGVCLPESVSAAPPVDPGASLPCPARSPVFRSLRLGAEASNDHRGLYAVDGPVPIPGESGDARLSLVLDGPERARVGARLHLSHHMLNTSPRPLAIVRSVDGSEEGMRAPRYALFVRDDAGVVWRWGRTGSRCGSVNPLGHGSVVALPPGERVDEPGSSWSSLDFARIDAPGEYTLWLVYTMCQPSSRSDGAVVAGHPVLFGTWASNPITISVSAGER